MKYANVTLKISIRRKSNDINRENTLDFILSTCLRYSVPPAEGYSLSAYDASCRQSDHVCLQLGKFPT